MTFTTPCGRLRPGRQTSGMTVPLWLSVVAFSACGSDNPAGTNLDSGQTPENVVIRSIDEVAVEGPPRMTNITSSTAVLEFVSTTPLACSVIYGETTAYGMIATDQDMDGGAHEDHHPLLTGLEPDTEYHYRVQGSAADGTVFVGEDMTFRSLPAGPAEETNLLSPESGARVTAVSSNFGDAENGETWGADSAIDGNPGTAWSSAGDGNGAFIEIELAKRARLSAVEVWTRSMSNGTAQILEFTLTTDSGDALGPFVLEDASRSFRFEIDAVTRTVRPRRCRQHGWKHGVG